MKILIEVPDSVEVIILTNLERLANGDFLMNSKSYDKREILSLRKE